MMRGCGPREGRDRGDDERVHGLHAGLDDALHGGPPARLRRAGGDGARARRGGHVGGGLLRIDGRLAPAHRRAAHGGRGPPRRRRRAGGGGHRRGRHPRGGGPCPPCRAGGRARSDGDPAGPVARDLGRGAEGAFRGRALRRARSARGDLQQPLLRLRHAGRPVLRPARGASQPRGVQGVRRARRPALRGRGPSPRRTTR